MNFDLQNERTKQRTRTLHSTAFVYDNLEIKTHLGTLPQIVQALLAQDWRQ